VYAVAEIIGKLAEHDYSFDTVYLNCDELRICLEAAETAFMHEFEPYLKILKDKARQSRLKSKISELLMLPTDYIDPEELLKFLEVERETVYNDVDKQSEAARLNYISQIGNPRECFEFGFPILDKAIGGLEIPSVCTVGARASTGKTSFVLNAVSRAADKGLKTTFFSLEMPTKTIYDRLVSINTGIGYWNVRKNYIGEEEKEQIRQCVEKMKGKVIITDNTRNIESIATAVRQIKPDIAVIDYIQQVQSAYDKSAKLLERMEHTACELRAIANDNNCVVIALSQITRAGKDRPTMSDLYGGTPIEANSDVVIILHRPYVLDKREGDPERTELIVDKNKFGETGLLNFVFEGRTQTFREVDCTHEPPPRQKYRERYSEE
jgi:replicative DNA helicase